MMNGIQPCADSGIAFPLYLFVTFRFSLTNLHATEIFEYAIGLSGVVSPLQVSVEYQRRRLQYAQLLASFGGFNAEAFRYLLSVAGAIWNSPGVFSTAELTTLTELADR